MWGTPRIHGELLKLGFEIAELTVSKYMIRHGGLPSQSRRTFLRSHAEAIAAIDLCVVRTVTFECLFVFLVIAMVDDNCSGLPSRGTRLPNGWRSRSWRRFRGIRRRDIWCATMTVPTGKPSKLVSALWVSILIGL